MSTENKAFDLTPNFNVIFRQFIKDATAQSKFWLESLAIAQLYPEETPQTRARHAVALRAVQSFFAPVTIALQTATSVTEIEQVRAVMADALELLNKRAAEFEDTDIQESEQ